MAYAIVTREHDGAARYAAALVPLGLDVIAMPVTRHVPPAEPDAVRHALAAGGFDAVMVASARAAAAVVAAGQAVPEVWAIGPATASVLRAAGIATVREPAVRDVAELAHALVRDRPGVRRVVVPRAEDGRVDGLAILRAAGVEVIDVIAYRTLAIGPDDPGVARGRGLLVAGQCAVCVVFAPSQVAALDAIVPIARLSTILVAIGDTTASALADAGAIAVAVAAEPTPEGVANAVAAVYPRR